MLLSGLGSFDNAIQNSPCVSAVKLTSKDMIASTGRGIAIPKVPCSLKLLTPKLIPLFDAEMPKAGILATAQFPASLVSIKSGSLETTCQRSRQLMGGEIWVGVAVSVGVGETVSVNGMAVAVEVGDGVRLGSMVAVAGTAVLVGSGFCTAPIICGETEIKAATIVPVTPRTATSNV